MKKISQGAAGLFKTFESKANGTVFTLLILNLLSMICLGTGIFLSENSKIFIIAGIVIFIIAVIMGFLFLTLLKSGINDATDEVLELFSSNASGGQADLSKVNKEFRHAEALKISEKYEIFLSSIRKLIDDIRAIDIDIAIDATQLAATVIDTANKTAEQRELSEVVTAASNEANSAIAEVSENAQYVSEKTTDNLAMAKKSYEELMDVTKKIAKIHETVSSFINTVEELGQSSATILGIVNIINGISEQTNLLSLNATIEAARAAEHGKGFAVVAEEVRELSRSIKPATEEITTNINSMISIVKRTQTETTEILQYSKETNLVVGKATENFQTMITDFEMTDDQLMKIAAAIEELSTNNNEITHKVEDINSLSQNIAEEMEKSKISVNTLNNVTEKMLGMVSSFKTGDGKFDWLIEKATEARDAFQQEIQKISDSGINVFDTNYQKIPNTEPQKLSASYTSAFESQMCPLYDEHKRRIPNTIYVIAIARDGYLPAHHTELSQPMTGDPKRDLLFSRHMRMFQTLEMEIKRSHTEELLLQTNMRDTGEIINDLSLPIYINNKHWGALIMGFDPKAMFTD